MVVQFFSHSGQSPLTDEGLDNIDEVFESAGSNYGRQIHTAIQQQQVDFSQLNGLVDYSFLHFQRKNPCKNRNYDNKYQQYLEFNIARKYP